ncbi:glycosyltransferase family 4 protein [Nitratifractor sp.]
MKILFMISSLASGGAERVMVNLANRLSKSHEVYIATFSDEEPYYLLGDEIKHLKLGLLKSSKSIFDRIKNTFFRIKTVKNTIEEIDADVQISFMTHTNIISIIASKLAGGRVIVSERIAYDFYGSRYLNLLRRAVYPMSDALVTQTYADKKHYAFMHNVKVIYNPLFVNAAPGQKEKIVLAVGRLDKQKGFDRLIETFAQIETDWKLLIAGDGPERSRLELKIRDLEAENIQLVGRKKNIEEYYAKASVFVLSSRREGFPNVLIEAMAYGCAVVSFVCPYGPAEIIEDGVDGILVENQNHEQMKEQLERVIGDEELRKRLGKTAQRVRDRYAVDKIACEWERLIEEVLNE